MAIAMGPCQVFAGCYLFSYVFMCQVHQILTVSGRPGSQFACDTPTQSFQPTSTSKSIGCAYFPSYLAQVYPSSSAALVAPSLVSESKLSIITGLGLFPSDK